MEQIFDVAIIGGGINGCGCAADAALRGLSVVLFEQDDLASKTSSSSTKLIHGGLRYLEYYEFSLVKKAIKERQILLTVAPHLVHPQAFILPYQKHMRSSWVLRFGLFLYDHLSFNNRLPRSKEVSRKKDAYFEPLKKELNQGYLFYDATTDDVRLTISNALQAKKHGAQIRPRERVIKTEAIDNVWHLTIQPQTGISYQIKAKTIINATGPWVEITSKMMHKPADHKITLVKGSHIVVPKLYEGEYAYFLQNADNRIIFVIPYHGYSMIGTTEVPFNENMDKVHISQEEVDYLTTLVNSYFNKQINSEDIIYSWSGVRPLLASNEKTPSALSRDYYYEITDHPAPLITIFGGKITTYRQLAEEIIDQLKKINHQIPLSLTKNQPLPGATWNSKSLKEYSDFAKEKYSWLDDDLLNRYLLCYGTNTELFLNSCSDIHSLGKKFGKELYEVEINYLIENEWAYSVDDILIRRTKLGLAMNKQEKNDLNQYLTHKYKDQSKKY